jgi:hypothetical protein
LYNAWRSIGERAAPGAEQSTPSTRINPYITADAPWQSKQVQDGVWIHYDRIHSANYIRQHGPLPSNHVGPEPWRAQVTKDFTEHMRAFEYLRRREAGEEVSFRDIHPPTFPKVVDQRRPKAA